MSQSYRLTCAVLLLAVTAVQAAPVDHDLPQTTKAMLSVRQLAQLSEDWDTTQLGQLFADPAMKPFVEDVQRQVRAQLAETGIRLGIELQDVRAVCTGGAALAATQPGSQLTAHALLLIVEVAGKEKDAEQLMLRAAHDLGGGQWVAMGEDRAVRAHVQGASGQAGHDVYFCISKGRMVVCDSDKGLLEAMAAIRGTQSGIKALPAYQVVMEKVKGDSADIAWFIDPFGYVQTCRANEGGEGPVASLLASQGFEAVKGAGGNIQLATGEHEVLHRSFVHVPAGIAQLEKAAKLLAFVNSPETSRPTAMVPGTATNFARIKFDFQEAFAGLKPLVNAIANDDIFDATLHNIATKPNGPRVDIRREVLPNLGQHITVFSDRELPIGPDSERMLIAIEVKNETLIRSALGRWLRTEPRVELRRRDGREIWEYIPEAPSDPKLAVEIDSDFGGDFDFGGGDFEFETQPAAAPAKSKQEFLPHAAVTVANGHVLVATHIEYLVSVLKQQSAKLDEATDYRRTRDALEKLGGGNDSIHFFTRLDGAMEVSYELLRTGRMPQSKSMLGMALNLLKEDANGTQQFDGSKMPAFSEVSKYLGPHGLFVQEEERGWVISGCLLKADPAGMSARPVVAR
ncbi:MAG: hypothetical protein KDB14_24960 [Planctomycetales bacterium]|nr:hypothetical protein [Planctomycetales bacterium]